MDASIKLFRALADPTRLAIVARLSCMAEPSTVTAISGCCGVHLSGVSRHLAMLRDAGLVRAQKNGREVRYSLNGAAAAVVLRELASTIEETK